MTEHMSVMMMTQVEALKWVPITAMPSYHRYHTYYSSHYLSHLTSNVSNLPKRCCHFLTPGTHKLIRREYDGDKEWEQCVVTGLAYE